MEYLIVVIMIFAFSSAFFEEKTPKEASQVAGGLLALLLIALPFILLALFVLYAIISSH